MTMVPTPTMQQEEDTPMKEEQDDTTVQSTVTLSKSWSIQATHEPMYTGGKLTVVDDDDEASSSLLVLPVGGNLALVQAGKVVCMVRQEQATDDDDDGVDGDAITAWCVHPQSKLVLTASQNHVLRQYRLVYNDDQALVECKFIKTFGKSGHMLPVSDMQFHLSGVFVATASIDGTVRIWDVRRSYMTHVFRPLLSLNDNDDGGGSARRSVTAIQWRASIEQLVIAIGRDDGSVCIHNLREDSDNHNKAILLREHVSSVTCMDWYGDYFVTAGRDAVLNLWTMREGAASKQGVPKVEYDRMQTLPIYEQVEGMVLLPRTDDTCMVATAGSKGRVRLWQVNGETDKLELSVEQPQAGAFGEERGGYMALALVSGRLLVADAEHNLSFLSPSSLETERTMVGHNDDILDVKTIPNESRIVVATNSSKVRVFDRNDFSCQVLDRHTGTVLCVDVSPCGRFVATCGKDKQARLWHLKSSKCVAVAVGHTEAVGAVALSRKMGRYGVGGKAAKNGGGAFCVTASVDRTLKRWNLPGSDVLEEHAESGKEFELKTSVSIRAHEKDINIVSIAPNDSLVASGSQDKTVKLWKASDLSLQVTLKGHKRGVWDCQFSPYDRVLVTGSGDRTIKLWSLSDYSCVRTFQGHTASVLRVRFLNGGLQLVSSGADGLLKLWTIRTNECEATMDGHDDKVWALDLFTDGKTLVSGGGDSKLVVWEDTTKEVAEAKQAEEEEAILLDQQLANHLRRKEFKEALNIALRRDKPQMTLKVLTSIIEGDIEKGNTGVEAMQQEVTTWSTERLVQILRYCREWNTRARNCHVAMIVCKAIVTAYPVVKLASIDGVAEIMAGITAYAERHFERLDRLRSNSYLLDFALSAMGSLDADDGSEADFARWEAQSKLVLPPKVADGRVQIGGRTIVGAGLGVSKTGAPVLSDDESSVVTIGQSEDSDDE